MSNTAAEFVRHFRQSAPYIHRHRGRTFVVFFPGEALQREEFSDLVHDLALLTSLGIRLVLVAGARPQIDACCANAGLKPLFHHGRRVTDDAALACVKQAAGSVRVEIEALLSRGLPNSPMAGASLRVGSGNFVKAMPLGVVDGVDYQHTGKVRRIDADSIRRQLDSDSVVALSLIGYSPSGEIFNLRAEEVAAEAAIALQADKLILFTDCGGLSKDGELIRQMRTMEAQRWLQQKQHHENQNLAAVEAAVQATAHEVERAHLIGLNQDGGLLRELFTHDGVGTLVGAQSFDITRQARLSDIGGILELIAPLEADGTLVRRSREQLEMEIEHFHVIERDGLLVACAALYPFADEGMAELACLAVHPEYRGDGRGAQMLHYIEQQAQTQAQSLFVLTTQTAHWFIEHGFVETPIERMPVERQQLYNWQRNAKIFQKTLAPTLLA